MQEVGADLDEEGVERAETAGTTGGETEGEGDQYTEEEV